MSKNPMKEETGDTKPQFSSDSAEKLAAENKIDPTTIEGTAQGGKISVKDVKKAMAAKAALEDQNSGADAGAETNPDQEKNPAQNAETPNEDDQDDAGDNDAADSADQDADDQETDEDDEEKGDEIAEIKESILNFHTAVKGALNTKPKILDSWKAFIESVKKSKSGKKANIEMIDGLVSFHIPVKDVFNKKPTVLDNWNKLIYKAIAAKRNIK